MFAWQQQQQVRSLGECKLFGRGVLIQPIRITNNFLFVEQEWCSTAAPYLHEYCAVMCVCVYVVLRRREASY